MAIIPDDQLKRLQDAGLFGSRPARSTHVMPDFVFINKPISVSGNSIPDFETQYGLDQGPKFNAPFLRLYFDNPVRMLDYTGIIPRRDLNCHLPLYLPNSQSISHPCSIKSDTPSGTFTGPNSSHLSPA